MIWPVTRAMCFIHSEFAFYFCNWQLMTRMCVGVEHSRFKIYRMPFVCLTPKPGTSQIRFLNFLHFYLILQKRHKNNVIILFLLQILTDECLDS